MALDRMGSTSLLALKITDLNNCGFSTRCNFAARKLKNYGGYALGKSFRPVSVKSYPAGRKQENT